MGRVDHLTGCHCGFINQVAGQGAAGVVRNVKLPRVRGSCPLRPAFGMARWQLHVELIACKHFEPAQGWVGVGDAAKGGQFAVQTLVGPGQAGDGDTVMRNAAIGRPP